MELFMSLPICYVINKKIFVVHGGIPSEDKINLEQINKLDRFHEDPEDATLLDLLWCDFDEANGKFPSKRGPGMIAGPDIAAQFLARNKLELIIRSHEDKMEGYHIQKGGKVYTVFSAPNYCDVKGNKGAYLKLTAPSLMPVPTQFTQSVCTK